MRASGGGLLLDLVNAEASPYRTSGGAISVRGPSVALDARAFSVAALVIHELITNAAKYGALSVKTGELTVGWSANAGGDCEILWQERGGPPVTPPSRQGFGSILIDRSIPYDLGGRSDLVFESEGVTAKLSIPAKFVRWSQDAASPEEASVPLKGKPGRPLEGKRVLLVDDQFIIAMDCEDMLATLGASQVEVCANVSEALSFLSRTTPDLAVLDVNLGSETSEPVGNRLRELGVPFLFATGYDDLAILGVAEATTLRKPYNLASLEAALRRLPGVA